MIRGFKWRRSLLPAALAICFVSPALAFFLRGGSIEAVGPTASSLVNWFISENDYYSGQWGTTGGSAGIAGLFNGSTGTEWVRGQAAPYGDWIDMNGTLQGTLSYASNCTGGLNSSCQSPRTDAVQTWNMPILQLVQEAVASQNQVLELFILESPVQGRSINDRTTGTPPHIDVTYSDASTATLAVLDNVSLQASNLVKNVGPFALGTNLGLHFAMPNPAKTVTAATLVVTATATQFGTTAQIKVFRVDEPLHQNGIDNAGVTTGYANAYSKDVGLGADPKTWAYFDGTIAVGPGGMHKQDGGNHDLVASWDFGPSPDTAKMPWTTLGQFAIPTDAQYLIKTLTGTTTLGSPIVTGLSSTTGVLGEYWALSDNVPIDAMVLTVDSGTQVTLTENATANGSVTIRFIPHAEAIYLTGNTTLGSQVISGISSTAALTTGMRVASHTGVVGSKGGIFPYPTVIAVTDGTSVTTTDGHVAAATQTGAQFMFVKHTQEDQGSGSFPIAVPETYTGNGYAPLYPGAGAIMYRVQPGQEAIVDSEYYFVPTTDGDPASTYAPGVDATGTGVDISQTRNLTMNGSTNGFSCTNGSPTITVTDPTHGAATGDWIQIPVQVYVCGVILHDWYKITVLDANRYTILSEGVWWYSGGIGTQANATSTVTLGGAVPTITTTSGIANAVVTTPFKHAQNPKHFDKWMFDIGGNFTIHNVVISSIGYKNINTGCRLAFNAACGGSNPQDANFDDTHFSLNASGGTTGTANATGTQGINCASQVDGCTGRAIVRYQTTGTVPWPTGTTPEEVYTRFYMRQHLTPNIPLLAGCNGGKWALGPAHRTTVSSNGGACACVRPEITVENHFGGKNGWSGRGQFFLGNVDVDAPEYGRLIMGTYQYNFNECQGDDMFGPRGASWAADEWHLLEVRTKMNTYNTAGTAAPGAAPTDGLVEAWVDGVKTFSKNYKWREQPPYDQMLNNTQLQVVGKNAIKSIWFNSFFGGTCGVTFSGAFFITHVVISSNYVGPMGN